MSYDFVTKNTRQMCAIGTVKKAMQEHYNVIASNIDYHKRFVGKVSVGGRVNNNNKLEQQKMEEKKWQLQRDVGNQAKQVNKNSLWLT